jgi:hypothetical protein
MSPAGQDQSASLGVANANAARDRGSSAVSIVSLGNVQKYRAQTGPVRIEMQSFSVWQDRS